MTALLALLAPFWKPITAAFATLATYLKGRSDAKRAAELKDVRNAEDIRRKGSAARDAAARGSVHDDDGWRRD